MTRAILEPIVTASASLSLIGSILSIAAYFRFRELRSQRSKLVFYLSLSDLGESVGWLLYHGSLDRTVCMTQAVLLQYFVASTIFWTMNLSINAFIVSRELVHDPTRTVRPSNFQNVKYEMAYHLIGWGFAMILLIVGLTKNLIGFSGTVYWCWLATTNSPIAAIYLIWAHVFVALFVAAVLYALSKRHLKRQLSSSGDPLSPLGNSVDEALKSRFLAGGHDNVSPANQEKIAGLHVWLYAFVTLLCYTPAVSNRLYFELYGTSIYGLMVTHALFKPLQGFLDFLVYGLSEKIRAPKNFKETLDNPTCRYFFKKFLTETFSSENLDFYESCLWLVDQMTTWSESLESGPVAGQLLLNVGEQADAGSGGAEWGSEPGGAAAIARLQARALSAPFLELWKFPGGGARANTTGASGAKNFWEMVRLLNLLVLEYISSDGRFALNLSSQQIQTSLELYRRLGSTFPFLNAAQMASNSGTQDDAMINVDAGLRKELLEGVKSVLRTPFDVVFGLLELDSFQRFQQSSLYFDMIVALEASENLQSRPLIVELFRWFVDRVSRKEDSHHSI